MFSFIAPSRLFAALRKYASDEFYDFLEVAALDQIPWTEMQIYHKDGKVYGQYRFSDILKRLIGTEVAAYLENFEIDFENPEAQKFCIFELYHAYPLIRKRMVKPRSLQDYFGQFTQDDSYLHRKPDIEGFLQAEAHLIKQLLGSYDDTSLFFQPVPLGSNGVLQRVIYLIFDESKIARSEKVAIDLGTQITSNKSVDNNYVAIQEHPVSKGGWGRIKPGFLIRD